MCFSIFEVSGSSASPLQHKKVSFIFFLVICFVVAVVVVALLLLLLLLLCVRYCGVCVCVCVLGGSLVGVAFHSYFVILCEGKCEKYCFPCCIIIIILLWKVQCRVDESITEQAHCLRTMCT